MKKLLVASTSTTYGGKYLEYILTELDNFFDSTEPIIFIPYARPGGITHDKYTEIVRNSFKRIGKEVIGLHKSDNPKKTITNAKGIFVGGGNTFVLMNKMYELNLLEKLKSAILSGVPYLGTSAGSNLCGLTIGTSNDMPIVYPPSFAALGVLPFNINPHYRDSNPESKHMGETRNTRIKEFHFFNDQPVIGLREGSYLKVNGDKITLKGKYNATIFEKEKPPYELLAGENLKFQ
jgi:dipeptidase E